MGLDVYLCKGKLGQRYQDPYWKEEFGEEERYQEGCESEKWKYNDPEAPELQIRIDSAKYPEHYFKIGYWRSSYNEGGINRVLRDVGLPDLYDIAGVNDQDYHAQPDWDATRTRALEVIEQLRLKQQVFDGFNAIKIDDNIFSSPLEGAADVGDALSRFLEEHHKLDTAFAEGYSNKNGEFFVKPLQVHAVIHGKSDTRFAQKGIGRAVDVQYLIYKQEGEDKYDWYIQSLEIVVETCDYVLAHPESEWHLHWSA